MRVLNLISSLSIGGAERQLSYLASELARRGHEIHVGYLHEGPNLIRLESSGVLLHRLVSSSNYDPRILLQIAALVREIRPDLIQTWILQMDILGGIVALVTRTPWILREPSSKSAYPLAVKNALRVRLGVMAGGIISNSEGGDTYWQSKGRKHRRYIIPNGLPLEEIEQASTVFWKTLGLDSTQKVVLYVGRFEHYKNLHNLIVSLEKVLRDVRAVALLCGDGPLFASVKQMVCQYQCADRVRLMGPVTHVWGLMKLAHVFVSVGYFEGCPNAVIEAMTCGCPLVVSDIPAHREFLDDTNAILVNPNEPALIADGIVDVLSRPEEARARAQTAKKTIEQWSISSVATQYEQIYSEVLAFLRDPLVPAS